MTSNITQNNLNDIANELRKVANKVPPGKDMNEIKVNLKNQALHLSSYQVIPFYVFWESIFLIHMYFS